MSTTTYTANDFYNTEFTRLQQKQINATDILSSKQRHALLNDSYRKRYAKYVEILVVLVGAVAIYLGIVSLQTAASFIPQIIFDLLTFLLMGGVFIYLCFAFYELYTRNALNYDELDLPAYDASGVDANSIAPGMIVAGVNRNATCVGQACCPQDYTWNIVTNICEANPNNQQGFTTIDNAYVNTKFDSPSLKRSPNSSEGVTTTVDISSLTFSKF